MATANASKSCHITNLHLPIQSEVTYLAIEKESLNNQRKILKGNANPVQAVEAHSVVRRRDCHIF
jgi:hypothetical protein